MHRTVGKHKLAVLLALLFAIGYFYLANPALMADFMVAPLGPPVNGGLPVGYLTYREQMQLIQVSNGYTTSYVSVPGISVLRSFLNQSLYTDSPASLELDSFTPYVAQGGQAVIVPKITASSSDHQLASFTLLLYFVD